MGKPWVARTRRKEGRTVPRAHRLRLDAAGLAAHVVSWTYIAVASAGRVSAGIPVSHSEIVASVAPTLRACVRRAELVREAEDYLRLNAR
jgi:hypothetical protein